MSVKIRLLGHIQVTDVDTAYAPVEHLARSVLATLVLNPHQIVTVDVFKSWCWDDAPTSASANLRNQIARLRAGFDAVNPDLPGRLVTHRGAKGGGGGGYQLLLDEVTVDVHEFTAAVALADNSLRKGHESEAIDHCARAMALWNGGFGVDLRPTLRFQAQSDALCGLMLAVEETGLAARLLLGRDPHVSMAEAITMRGNAPHRHRRWLLHAAARYLDGDLDGALATNAQSRTRYAERGHDLPQRLADLQHAMLNQVDGRVRALVRDC